MGHFALLPAELQIQIFDYLGTVDVKAARAVSTGFRDNATPALFRSVVACARYQALGACQNVSLHSIYSGYVREIIFDGTVYESNLAYHQCTYQRHEKAAKKFISLPRWSERLRWKRYGTLYEDQVNMIADEVLLQTLARGLENMQNISSIRYSPHHHIIPMEKKELRDLLPPGSPPGSFGSSELTASDHPFRQLIGAVFLSGYTGVEQLTVEAPRSTGGRTEFSLAMFSFPGPSDLDAAKHLFCHLVRLELNVSLSRDNRRTIGMGHSDEIEESAKRLDNLAKVVEAAQVLRHLSFGISAWVYPAFAMYGHIIPHGGPIFSYLGLGSTWPKLRSLSLRGVCANERDLIDLITRHSDTLRALNFSTCSLCRGIWAEVVNEVIFNASMISTFILDRVNEAGRLSVHAEADSWRYEGHMVIAKDGEREFVDSNPDKKSVYEAKYQTEFVA